MERVETEPTELSCPKSCGNTLEYGSFVDAREGIRGYSCPECNLVWTTGELKRKGVIDD